MLVEYHNHSCDWRKAAVWRKHGSCPVTLPAHQCTYSLWESSEVYLF